MTHAELIRERDRTAEDYEMLSRAFFPSFLEVEGIPKNKIDEREEDIIQLRSLLEKKLISGGLTREQKIVLMDYLDRLQLTIDYLEEKRNPRSLPIG